MTRNLFMLRRGCKAWIFIEIVFVGS